MGEFEKARFAPVVHTLPQRHDIDVFADYLKPFLLQNEYKTFSCGDTVQHGGVEFRLMATDPEKISARIGKEKTLIFCEGESRPSYRSLISRDGAARDVYHRSWMTS